MNNAHSQDWWLWRMYRQVAEFVNDPSEENRARLDALTLEYRHSRLQQRVGLTRDHDWVVDFQ